MLLEQALAEFSEIDNGGNAEPKWENVEERHAEKPDSLPQKEINTVECNRNVCLMSPELKLHLESEREFFNRLLIRNELANRNSEDSLACSRTSVSVPFKWEEKPGKPKDLSIEEAPLVLSLPPVRHPSLNSDGSDARFIANSPRTLSGRLRGILLAKLHPGKLFDPSTERPGEKLVVTNESLQYPEEFGCSSQKDSSPVSIFECPDSPSSSSSSLLSYCSRPPSSTRQDSVSALLANRLVPMKEMLNAVPVENSCPVCPNLPASFVSVNRNKNSGSKMIGSSSKDPTRSSRIRQEFMRAQSVNVRISSNASRRESSMGKRSAGDSSRSVSWGGTEIIDAKEFKEQIGGLIPVEEEQVKGKCWNKIKDNDLHRAVSSMPSAFFPVEQISGSPTSLSSETSGSTKMVYFGHQRRSDSCYNSFQGIARSNRHSNNVRKHFKNGFTDDSDMGVKGPKKTMGSCRKHSQMMMVRSKRWTFLTPLRMNIANCCSPAASNTVNCCSSRNASRNNNRNKDRMNSISQSNHQNLQMEWRKLYEEDRIHK